MAKRLLFCTGEGIGNVIQTIPVIRTLVESMGYVVDFWHAFGSYSIPPGLFPYVDKWYFGAGGLSKVRLKDYTGKVATFWARENVHDKYLESIPLLNTIKPLSMNRSEVDTYMDIARDLGVDEPDIIWHGECGFNKVKEKFDVVMHDGYKKSSSSTIDWSVKSFAHYRQVAEMLNSEFSICCIGAKTEGIRGTTNKTGMDLLTSLGYIKNAKVFVSNDSGLYHCANALGIPTVAIFTATSTVKNYDPRFHKFTTIVGRNDLKCRPCQKQKFSWTNGCTNWECRNVDIRMVCDTIRKHAVSRELRESVIKRDTFLENNPDLVNLQSSLNKKLSKVGHPPMVIFRG